MDETHLIESTISEKKIFDGDILHVRVDQILLPNGLPATREIIRHIGAVCVLPLISDEKVVMERQYRYPVARILREIPAGKLDSADEPPLDAVKRELREETGYEASEWISLGKILPAPAYCDEVLYLYLALGLHAGSQKLDSDEFLDVETVPLSELVEDVMNGKIEDAKTQIAVLKTWNLLKKRNN